MVANTKTLLTRLYPQVYFIVCGVSVFPYMYIANAFMNPLKLCLSLQDMYKFGHVNIMS